MPSMADIRAKFPQYNDLTDDQLAHGVHGKFYSDMSFQDFAGKIGYTGQQEPNVSGKQNRDDFSYTEDILRSAGSGLRSGAESLLGTLGDVQDMTGSIAGWGAGKLGASPETQETVRSIAGAIPAMPGVIDPPTTQDVRKLSDEYIGGDRYQPKSVAGEYANTAGNFVGAGALTPGGALRRGAMVAAPAIASETAGQVARNLSPEHEDLARLGGAVVGGFAGGAGARKAGINRALKGSMSGPQLKRARNRAYQKIRDAGVTYDSNAFGAMWGDTMRKLGRAGVMQEDAPRTFARLNKIEEAVRQGKSPSWNEVNSIRVGLGRLAREVDGQGRPTTEAAAAAKAFGLLDDFERNAPAINVAGKTADELSIMREDARDLALRTIKGDIVGNRIAKADTYISGIESGLKNQSASLLRSKTGKMFNDIEKSLIQEVAGGSPLRNALTTAGRAGFDFSNLGNIALGLPSLAGLGTWAGTGDPWTAGFVVALASGAKFGARHIAVKDAQRALGIARMGPKGQERLAAMLKTRKGRQRLAQAVIAKLEATKQPLEVNAEELN